VVVVPPGGAKQSKNMIFTLILNGLYAFLTGLLLLLPVGHLPTVITTSFTYLFGIANTFSYVLPIATLMQALAVVLAFDAAVLLWHFFNWIIRKIPGMQ